MKIEELVHRYKKELPKTDTELEFIRAVCIKLGQEHSFDTRYYLGNSQTKRDIYKMAKRTTQEIGNFVEKRTIICVSLSYKMQALFKKFGYDIEIPSPEDGDDHVYPIITLHDGRKIKIDVQLDLENIQTKSRTKHFGTKEIGDPTNLEVISEEELKRIDRKIGYIHSEYRDDYIDSLYEETKGKETDEKLRILLSDPRTANIPDNMGYVEQNKYYFALLNRFFSLYELRKIYLVTCFKKEENKTEQYTNCIYYYSNKPDDEPQIYILSKKNNQYNRISTDKLQELKNQGLNIGIGLHERGANLLKKILKNRSNQLEPEKA